VALWTLGQVVESTAYVVEPYQKYPMLLDVLLSFLKTEQTPSIRREVFLSADIYGSSCAVCQCSPIVNKKQCETRGLFMSLVIHY